MVSQALFSYALFALVLGVTAIPAPTQTTARQAQFMFVAANTTPTPEAEPITVSPEPATAEVDPQPSPEAGDMPVTSGFTFAYNFGSPDDVGEFLADPEDWVVGETSTFVIPVAEIVTSPVNAAYADIYKSHRYGLLGSTWGYDIPVTTAGMYQCTVHYAETFSEFFTEEPNRTFKVSIGGDGDTEPQEAEFDVMVELGGQEFVPYTRTFYNINIQETLTVRETPSKGDSFLSGISCALTLAS